MEIVKKMIKAPPFMWKEHITPYLLNLGIDVPEGSFDFGRFVHKSLDFTLLIKEYTVTKKRLLLSMLLDDFGLVVTRTNEGYGFHARENKEESVDRILEFLSREAETGVAQVLQQEDLEVDEDKPVEVKEQTSIKA